MMLSNTKGVNSRTAKINPQIARHIVKCIRNGVPKSSMAALFGLTAASVHAIWNGKTWGDETIDLRSR